MHNKSVYGSLDAIGELEYDWNSYGAKPIDKEVIAFAKEFYEVRCYSNTIEPFVLPTPMGGIQFEWHTADIDLEIEITPEKSIVVLWCLNAAERSEEEVMILTDIIDNVGVR